MLYANSQVPLYKQLYRKFRDAIELGEMKVGDRLPSERKISARHGICRLTARKALELLKQDGYIEAYQGIGSFVALGQPIQEDGVVFESFDEQVRRLDKTPSTRVMSCGILVAQDELAQHLNVDEQTRIIKVRRLRFIDGKPVALHTAYLPHQLCAFVLDVDLEQNSLYRILEDELDIQLTRTEQTRRRVLGQPDDLALLGLEPPVVMMRHTQHVFDDLDRLVLYVDVLYRHDDPDLRMLF